MLILVFIDGNAGLLLASAKIQPKKQRMQQGQRIALPADLATRMKTAIKTVRLDDIAGNLAEKERRRLRIEMDAMRRRLLSVAPEAEFAD